MTDQIPEGTIFRSDLKASSFDPPIDVQSFEIAANLLIEPESGRPWRFDQHQRYLLSVVISSAERWRGGKIDCFDIDVRLGSRHGRDVSCSAFALRIESDAAIHGTIVLTDDGLKLDCSPCRRGAATADLRRYATMVAEEDIPGDLPC